MAGGSILLKYWETWFYGGLVLLTIVSAVASRNKKVEAGAYYLTLEWFATWLIWLGLSGRIRYVAYFVLHIFIMTLWYRLADDYADWVGFVFLVYLFGAVLHVLRFIAPETFNAYAWLLNASFITTCIIVVGAAFFAWRAARKAG